VGQKTSELAASTASLLAAERLASLGTMAAGLGHDMANLTLPIRVRLESLRGAVESDEAVADLDAIGEALAHLSRLSAGMRLMALDPTRESASTPADDLSAWADETVPMLRASLPRHVRLECMIAPGLGVSIPRHRLAQAVFNLVQNAGEAMAGRQSGTVRIVAEPAVAGGREVAVRLRVTDDGPGMTPEVRARCFEPYFSTKVRAISTGMGLGMVRGIIEAAGGTITVDSTPATGTTFCLTLPRVGASAIEAAAPRVTCAISVSQPRVARLVRLFLNEFRIASMHHEAASPPQSSLWVLEDDAAELLDEYLVRGPDRRAVVLLRHGTERQQRMETARARHGDRLVTIPENPGAGALRNAIAAAAGRTGVAATA
jgi:hypothetical protein